VGDDLLR